MPNVNHMFSPQPLPQWAREVEEDQEPTYIIKDFLPSDNLVLLSGQPKEGKKSFLAMLLALLAASGKSYGPLACERPVSVLYIYREGARKATLRRLEVLAQSHGLGSVYDLPNFHFHHRGSFWLDDPDYVAAACRFIEQNDINLVFIDTFAKSITTDENSSRDVSAAIQQTEKLRDAGATVVLVHHLKKGALAISNGVPDPDKDIRGSSALSGAYETHIAIRRYTSADMVDPIDVLILSGKEKETRAYGIGWEFNDPPPEGSDAPTLTHARLNLAALEAVPHIEVAKYGKSKTKTDDYL